MILLGDDRVGAVLVIVYPSTRFYIYRIAQKRIPNVHGVHDEFCSSPDP